MYKTLILFLWMVVIRQTPLYGQPDHYVVVKDLKTESLVFQDNSYQAFAGQKTKSLYFVVPQNLLKGDKLLLQSEKTYNVFINQQWITSGRQRLVLDIDSLSVLFGSSMTVGIFQKDGVEMQAVSILMPDPANLAAQTERYAHPQNYFLNFSVLAILILGLCFVLLYRANPRLTADYFNVLKLFSVQEQRENLLMTRVTSSVNLLFYLFCSGCCALGLLAIFYFGADRGGMAADFPIRSTGGAFLQWIKLIIIVGACITLKMVIIFAFTTLFRIRDTWALQFFNFIRTLFFVVGLITVTAIIYFMYYGYPVGPTTGLLKISLVIMTLSAIMIFLKILTLAPFSFFHLFSYLCASEIIPLMILIKILLF